MATLAGQWRRPNSPGPSISTTSRKTQKSKPTSQSEWRNILPLRQANGFRVEQVTQGQLYPVAEVAQYLPSASSDTDPGISEEDAITEIAAAVDITDVLRLGEGPRVVYAYGYRCAPDRLKIGLTEGDAVQRIAAQVSTGTPDRPVLFLEIRSHDCSSLERAIHATLEYRGSKVPGAGKEWFKTSREEVISILSIDRKNQMSSVLTLCPPAPLPAALDDR